MRIENKTMLEENSNARYGTDGSLIDQNRKQLCNLGRIMKGRRNRQIDNLSALPSVANPNLPRAYHHDAQLEKNPFSDPLLPGLIDANQHDLNESSVDAMLHLAKSNNVLDGKLKDQDNIVSDHMDIFRVSFFFQGPRSNFHFPRSSSRPMQSPLRFVYESFWRTNRVSFRPL